VDAFDISAYAVGVAAERLAAYPQATVREGDAQATNLPDGAYDMVVSLDVVEHLPQPERFFEEAFRVLRPGGLLYFSTPNPASLGARLKRARQLAADGGLPSERWFADRDETHINIRPRAAWRALCLGAGFVAVREGTDSLWDTPYFPRWPLLPQKLLGNGSQRLLIPLFGMLPWSQGENHIGLWRKP
jgi:2-polyprenyl-3-methyl-5-hydroxy-6-metoxy-1,4-benzoquinol methylase